MTRIYSLSEITPGVFSLRIAFYQKDSFYGVLEILYTGSDIYSVDYSQRFIAQTLSPAKLVHEIAHAINVVLRLRAGASIEDIQRGKGYPSVFGQKLSLEEFNTIEDF